MSSKTKCTFLIAFATAFLILASCGTTRSTSETKREQMDSVIVREVVRVDTLRIPGATTTIRVPVEVMKRDTILVSRSGHASAMVSIQDGVFTATAECDSLERMVLSYEREVQRLRTELNNSHHKEEKSRGFSGFVELLIWLGVILIVIIVILKIR